MRRPLQVLLDYLVIDHQAGADIKEMSNQTFIEIFKDNFIGRWSEITLIRKPIIAAVNGFAVRCLWRLSIS